MNENAGDEGCACGGLPPHAAQIAAQSLDLSRSHQLLYVGGDGEALAVFLDTWRQLAGVWFGSADGEDAARQFLDQRGLGDRVRYVVGSTLDAIPASDLVVLSALDVAVDASLRLLVSAGPGWLPPKGRWIILQREYPHLSSVVSPPLLHQQGLRVASRWCLPEGVHMLVCAPAHRFVEDLQARTDRTAALRRA